MDSYEALYCGDCGEIVGFGKSLDGRGEQNVKVLCSECILRGGKEVVGAEKILLPFKSSAMNTLIEVRSLAEAG